MTLGDCGPRIRIVIFRYTTHRTLRVASWYTLDLPASHDTWESQDSSPRIFTGHDYNVQSLFVDQSERSIITIGCPTNDIFENIRAKCGYSTRSFLDHQSITGNKFMCLYVKYSLAKSVDKSLHLCRWMVHKTLCNRICWSTDAILA